MTIKKHKFTSAKKLDDLITRYFDAVMGKPPLAPKRARSKTTALVTKRAPKEHSGAPTIAGLVLHLGFNSRQEFEEYESGGRFGNRLKRAKLRIEELYEKRLHTQFTSGAIYALKSLSGAEKPAVEAENSILTVVIFESGPRLAASEKEVVL